MKVSRKFQPEKAASKDASRPVLTCANLDVDKSRVELTDSYMLAVIPVEVEDGDVSGLIPAAAFPAARKSTDAIAANGSATVRAKDGSTLDFPRPDGQFPDVDRLADGSTPDHTLRVKFNAELLANLAKALGAGKTDGVTLSFVGTGGDTPGINPNRPIHVEGSDGAYGLLMPIRLA